MSARAVVIGGGIVGCGAALALVRKGWRVTVVERLPSVGLGSTASSSTVIRCHYTRPEAIRLALEGRMVWERWAKYLKTESPKAIYRDIGVLFLMRRGKTSSAGKESLGMKAEMDDHAIDARVQMMEYAGVDVDLLTARKLRRKFPDFSFPEDDIVGVWEPDSGYVAHATEAVEDLRDAALREGVAFRYETEVVGGETCWEKGVRRLNGVHCRDASGAFHTLPADAVVNCAGPHSSQVNVALECPLPLATVPQRQIVLEGTWANPTPLPAMADLATGFYLRPDDGLFKLGAVLPKDHVGFVWEPDGEVTEEARMEVQHRFLRCLATRAPGVQLVDVRTRVGFYDWTVSDSYPLIGPTDVHGYFVAIGTSGAWFKAGPVVGELIAECIQRHHVGDKRTLMTLPYCGLKLDLSRFSVSR